MDRLATLRQAASIGGVNLHLPHEALVGPTGRGVATGWVEAQPWVGTEPGRHLVDALDVIAGDLFDASINTAVIPEEDRLHFLVPFSPGGTIHVHVAGTVDSNDTPGLLARVEVEQPAVPNGREAHLADEAHTRTLRHIFQLWGSAVAA
ncbi:hypothetical protein [Leifsonia sp. Leaf264]|uniref:hypothetical protein n=1 Tax=Leifsonia sp. Leaf264 TaxID=1736314 RepID=UPI0007001B69|nr:hypothetical protein [Leifsonia sp. Leaf264]KQO98670.1 hypothetical protein ASF30_11450 [Leifsonia sp. Leaf264]